MDRDDRRSFLKVGGAALTSGVFVGLGATATAAEQKGHTEHGGELKSEKGAEVTPPPRTVG
jgi:hypothetical protein